ncbi:uncharacterized protein LOC143215230 [Lasioglossum baleicum]|uniref:uncharacterized protein LOC143215230 n=1 Tax=Lasioglossum baleicum TaxID=434251 RepID=UPI003FCE9813
MLSIAGLCFQKPLVRQPEDTMSVDRMQPCELHMQPRKKTVAIQVPDEVQAHQRDIADILPYRIRFLQPHVLVELPVPEGGGGRVNVDEEALGLRNVERSHSHHQYPTTTTTTTTPNTNARSHHPSRHRQPVHQHYHYKPDHRHHHHNVQRQPEEEEEEEEEKQQQQHLAQSGHRQLRFHSHPGEPGSASFPSLHNVGSLQPRSSLRNGRTYLKSSGRSSPSTSPSPSPFPSPTPSPITSRRATPSLPTSAENRPSFPNNERCCWGLLPRSCFTCPETRSARIDFIARRAFPLAFILFNLVYWSNYFFQGQDYDNRQQ